MASSSNNGGGMIEGINITPLVDITLVLLIIFIVTAKIIVTPAVPMDLPRAASSEELQIVFAVQLPASGELMVNGEKVAGDDELLARARGALARSADVRAVINADGSVPHRKVIATLDVLKRAGLARVAFGALPPEETAGAR
jgi:biopolymer transport protein ExbD